MTIEQLRNVYNAQPFKPFVLHLADGRSVAVPHRDFMATAPNGRTMVVMEAPDDRMHIIDLLLVTDIEIKPLAKPTGKKRRV
jgi:hypothetical protein